MTGSSLFPRFDGLMHLSKREGVDIRPTLLRVLTDLYVQAPAHTAEEQHQYAELASRLIDEVDDATRASVRARLAVYPDAPELIQTKLGLLPVKQIDISFDEAAQMSEAADAAPTTRASGRQTIGMQPADASAIDDMFFRANSSERVLILRNLEDSPLTPAARGDARRRTQAIESLEKAAFAADQPAFATALADALLLPDHVAERIVADASGEPLACAAKALAMPAEVFQRVLLFLKPEFGASIMTVYRLSRLYDTLNDRSALIMLAVWRGAMVARVRAKYRPALYDDERRRARPAMVSTPAPQSAAATPEPMVANVSPLRG